MTNEWTYCACGASYDAHLALCPICGAPNSYAAKKRGSGVRLAVVAAGIATALSLLLLLLAGPVLLPEMISFDQTNPFHTTITILQPREERPATVPQEELVEHALAAINHDRAAFGLTPVQLSTNKAAQIHAEDVYANKQISHWLSNGEKPYMTYTRLGGSGSVYQNVAISGFSQGQYERCVTTILLCEKIDPLVAIERLQYEMMYNDKECCNDGHRDNILDPHHTHVSIGIVYDDYYLAFVQNFENEYGLRVQVNGTTINISGPIPGSSELRHFAIYYDPLPTEAAYNEGKRMLAYDAGQLRALVLEPLPPGFRYQQPADHVAIEAQSWKSEDMVDTRFNISQAIEDPGVYTIYTMFEREGNQFSATSYSIFVSAVEQI